MNRISQDDFHGSLEHYRRLAHRERARAMHALIASMAGGVGRLLDKARTSLGPRQPGRWIARLG